MPARSIPGELMQKWQSLVDLLARAFGFQAALIMRTHATEIEVFLASHSVGNPYEVGEKAPLNTGLYCEAVMKSQQPLHVRDALADPDWITNPDVRLGMICYYGIPINMPDGNPFGTICVLDDRPQDVERNCREVMDLMRQLIENDLLRIVHINEETTASERVRQEAEDSYAAIFHQAAVGLARVGLDGTWLEVNERLCEIAGYERNELIGQTFQKITHPDDLDRDLEFLSQLSSGAIPTYSMEKRYFHKQGHIIWILLTVSLVRTRSGTPHYFISAIEDITEKKLLQRQFEQAQKLEVLGRLVGGIAHEFNNKLAAITGNLFMALRSTTTSTHYVQDAQKICFQASEMVKDLLAYARKDRTSKHVVNVGALLNEVFTSFRVLVPENIDLKIEMGRKQMLVWGRSTQLQQIVLNLVNNAVDAVKLTDCPQIAVRLDVIALSPALKRRHPSLTSARLIHLVVEDNGVGISNADMRNIFDPFFTTKAVGEGTGLGLAMVASLVEQHGGAIDVESTYGTGTSFNIYFALLEDMAADVKPEGPPSSSVGGGDTILLVDDNDGVLDITGQVLETLGFDVVTAHHGLQALEIYEAHGRISCVLTDVAMPKMGGVELYKRLKEIDRTVKVIFMTGHASLDDVSVYGRPILLKPIEPENLGNMLREILAN